MNQRATLKIDGMTCGGCEQSLTKALERLDGVQVLDASHQEGTVVIEFDAERVGNDQITDAVEEAGYDLVP
ncbi:MAG: heavy-metal-associated domain-containing protein [Actinomycetota bacterium]